jgi:hypothetical protein
MYRKRENEKKNNNSNNNSTSHSKNTPQPHCTCTKNALFVPEHRVSFSYKCSVVGLRRWKKAPAKPAAESGKRKKSIHTNQTGDEIHSGKV